MSGLDSAAEMTWVPTSVLDVAGVGREDEQAFETSDGRVLTRETGWAIVYAGGRAAPTVVVFSEPDDTILLGAIALESLNLRVDLMRKVLVPAGPSPAFISTTEVSLPTTSSVKLNRRSGRLRRFTPIEEQKGVIGVDRQNRRQSAFELEPRNLH